MVKKMNQKNIKTEQYKISYKDIEVSLGAPWISDFVYYLRVGIEWKYSSSNFVKYEPITGFGSFQTKSV